MARRRGAGRGGEQTTAMTRQQGDVNRSRSEFAYRTLREEIVAGILRPGERLREIELSTRLAVSRTPIREALRRLAEAGLAERALGGFAVRSLTLDEMSELYAVRSVLEGAAAGFAAQHASADDIARMRDWAVRCRDATTGEEAARCNEELHRLLHGASHNRFLIELQGRFSDWLALLPGTTYSSPARRASAYAEHGAIIAAIEARDAAGAQRAAAEHITRSGKVRLEQMQPPR